MISAALQTVEEQGESRRQKRRRLSLNIVTRAGDGTVQDVVIHDISIGGLLLESKVALAPGEVIKVELPEAPATTARVMWNSGRFYGCQFDRPIPTSAVSASLLQSPFRRLPAPAIQPADEAQAPRESPYDIPYEVERGRLQSGARIFIVVGAALALWTGALALLGAF